MGKQLYLFGAQNVVIIAMVAIVAMADDNNNVFQPCEDAKIQKSDGFTFGIAFSLRPSFFVNDTTQLSPCDRRLSLSTSNAQLAIFRPKVDQISLLTINTTTFTPEAFGGYMVAFAGQRYAARSTPTFVANSTFIVTSFTLVLEFEKGTLQNLYWKRDGCASCKRNPNFTCLNSQDCAINQSSCMGHGGSVDCSLGIQTAFSGTDKHQVVLNSWYEVDKLRQYSLYGLYSNLRDSLTSQFNIF
ncbi:hypothetical protein AMTRI_Chr05g65190 [Amborella trichopoda]|uniref:Expp1 protein n=1 Tax=Amborella trichopoda TaxID=13333 RepID=W1P7D6_AMBTC|nr:uncharacterized protein LOC18431984 [Amborella trichopoda]XP_011622518.1 uncharacterized protein LOC18431984 [Amborella trichopoda]XP_020521495.1 uncharacterized protein LOC18431984 [Amborella trichopoda]XP_020521496.1 uncharacterized protein LOC18431984 [Amborella trichopoda]XP_020521497.1 uncharacterized protein LOC18431984 [Amborella trichopoda]XP_020521498.1 uncharacterized protein LOC18431984 [Amborella trichopoda]XP_020521499.1 uncharacterized protein LOC18431984 [Amborella trichopod|eukprot:XP_006842158.1 uncharacterized protein LOC18431984 [Amborella trichopoda]